MNKNLAVSQDQEINPIAAENGTFDDLGSLLQDTLTRLGFVFPKNIQKNEAFVGEQEKAHVLSQWRETFSRQLRQFTLSLVLSTRVRGNNLNIAHDDVSDVIGKMIDTSVQKMEWLLDHRHVVGLYNDQVNFRRPLPVDIHFMSESLADNFAHQFTQERYQTSIVNDENAMIRVEDAIFIAPTQGPQSFDQSGMPVVRIVSDKPLIRIPVQHVRSVIAKAPDRHYAFFNPLRNSDGSHRDQGNVEKAYQLFNVSMEPAIDIYSDSQRFTYQKGI
jgi:hypothetical protein